MLPAFPFSWPLTPKFNPSSFLTLAGTQPTATRPKSCATHLLSLLHHQHKTQRYVSFSQKGGVPQGTFTPTRYTYINAHCSLFSDSITQPVTFNFFFLVGGSIISRASTSGVVLKYWMSMGQHTN